MRDVVAAPGPAMHLAVLGIVAVIALAIYGVVRRRHKRDAAEADRQGHGDSGVEDT